MQIILLIFGIFFVLCIIYGVFSGVGWVIRAPRKLRSIAVEPEKITVSESSPTADLQMLKQLHSLYTSGALSEDEFTKIKSRVISDVMLKPGNVRKEIS